MQHIPQLRGFDHMKKDLPGNPGTCWVEKGAGTPLNWTTEC